MVDIQSIPFIEIYDMAQKKKKDGNSYPYKRVQPKNSSTRKRIFKYSSLNIFTFKLFFSCIEIGLFMNQIISDIIYPIWFDLIV